MFAILIAIVLLFVTAAGLYLLLKNMSEEGIDIAAPGSCRRGRCGVPRRQAAEDAEEVPEQTADGNDQSKPNA
jgi:uncharacterized protein (UPF0333 family)